MVVCPRGERGAGAIKGVDGGGAARHAGLAAHTDPGLPLENCPREGGSEPPANPPAQHASASSNQPRHSRTCVHRTHTPPQCV